MLEMLINFPLENMFYFMIICLFTWSGFKRVMKYLGDKENKKFVGKFINIHSILSFHMDASYDTIHKDNILIYSLDGVKPDEKDIDHLTHEFVKLTIKLSGPNMIDIFTELYGDEDNLYFVMMDYFNRRFEDDEIRATAIDNIQEGEDI
jgi:hypothetical protein